MTRITPGTMKPRSGILPSPDSAGNKPEFTTVATPVGEHNCSSNIELPIDFKRQEIVQAIENSQATIISAETGAGKSTRVPRMLMDAGYEVVVTQPRRLAARTIAERVKEELTDDVGALAGSLVGFRTARERDDSPENKILFCTDGLQLVRELSSRRVHGKKQVLVLDEIHEWNTNIEVLVAWAKNEMKENPDFKVVCMSATLASSQLAQFFGADTPVIEVEGRTYPVEKKIGTTVIEDTVKAAKAGKNVLVFLPGKAEITKVEQELATRQLGVPILQLHGQMDRNDQKKAFEHYPKGKIILATNVAQTSITINDIDVVVDSGIERRTEIIQGVEGLYLGEISQADCLQRAGRAGRVKPGEYILSSLNGEYIKPIENREPFAVPEIKRTRLDSTVMKMAGAGLDIENLEFFHQPSITDIKLAKQRLTMLGALDGDGQLTKIGIKMERLPVDSHYGRMLVEIQKYNDPELTYMLMEMIAIQQAGGIVKSGKYNQKWKDLISNKESDLLAELEIFHKLSSISRSKWKENDLLDRNISEARQILALLQRSINVKTAKNSYPNEEQQVCLQKAIVAGLIDQVWYQDPYGSDYISALSSDRRQLSRSSVVDPRTKYLVGSPFDLQIQGRRGRFTLLLLQDATAINPKWLSEIAPRMIKLVSDSYSQVKFDSSTGRPSAAGKLMFGRIMLDTEEIEPTSDQKLSAYYNLLLNSEHLYASWYKHLQNELENLSAEVSLFDIEYADDLKNRFYNILKSRLTDNVPSSTYNCLANPPKIEISDIFCEEDINIVESIKQKYPDSIAISDEIISVLYQSNYYRNLEIVLCLNMVQARKLLHGDLPKNLPGMDLRLQDDEGQWRHYSGFEELRNYIENLLKLEHEDQLDEDAIKGGNLTNFGGSVRLGTGSCNLGYWVITTSGELRPAGDDGRWKVLRDGELAISVDYPEKDSMVGKHLVAWRNKPISDRQVEAVRQIEESLSMSEGAWAISDDEAETKDKVVQAALKDEFLGLLLDHVQLSSDQIYNQLCSNTGLRIYVDPKTIYKDSIEIDENSGVYADGIEAIIMETIQITETQAVQVLAYYKYGSWNIALKLVEREEAIEIAEQGKDPVGISQSDLEALMNKFNT